MSGMRIGEVAQASGTTAKTLRYYEDVGLLPDPDRSPAGYRDYGPEVLDRLHFIRRGQAAGLTLAQIGQVLAIRDRGQAPCQHVTDLLKNTLQVKVRLEAPPAIWRPETLCRARFFRGLDLDAAQPAKAAATVFLVPKSTIRDGRVYVIEPAHGVARAIPVTVVGEDGDLAIVGGELSVTQRVIREAVADGEAVEEKQP